MVTMSLAAIVAEILTTTEVETLPQLAMLVAAHHAFTGKSKGRDLEKRIKRILRDEQFQQSMKSDSYIEVKLGRFKGTIDLS